jgi:hypothetical protein
VSMNRRIDTGIPLLSAPTGIRRLNSSRRASAGTSASRSILGPAGTRPGGRTLGSRADRGPTRCSHGSLRKPPRLMSPPAHGSPSRRRLGADAAGRKSVSRRKAFGWTVDDFPVAQVAASATQRIVGGVAGRIPPNRKKWRAKVASGKRRGYNLSAPPEDTRPLQANAPATTQREGCSSCRLLPRPPDPPAPARRAA